VLHWSHLPERILSRFARCPFPFSSLLIGPSRLRGDHNSAGRCRALQLVARSRSLQLVLNRRPMQGVPRSIHSPLKYEESWLQRKLPRKEYVMPIIWERSPLRRPPHRFPYQLEVGLVPRDLYSKKQRSLCKGGIRTVTCAILRDTS
jgi:hypothetical protein